MRIFLIGYMGSGKSKVAEALGKILELPVIHTDKLVEEKEGKSISEILNRQGKSTFVILKRLYIQQLSSDVIVSTGGGLPCYFDNMEWMNQNGITEHLEANGLLFHRLSNAKAGRP